MKKQPNSSRSGDSKAVVENQKSLVPAAEQALGADSPVSSLYS
jgi:hypothetical protein